MSAIDRLRDDYVTMSALGFRPAEPEEERAANLFDTILDAERARVWDEAVEALAFLISTAHTDPTEALTYGHENNPYERAEGPPE